MENQTKAKTQNLTVSETMSQLSHAICRMNEKEGMNAPIAGALSSLFSNGVVGELGRKIAEIQKKRDKEGLPHLTDFNLLGIPKVDLPVDFISFPRIDFRRIDIPMPSIQEIRRQLGRE
jgi:hypothetical protein